MPLSHRNRQPHLRLFCQPAIRQIIFFISLLVTLSSFAQNHSVVVSPGFFYTRYGKTAVGFTNAFIPYVSVAAGSYYTEIRYNYDYDHTLGVYAGKTFYLTKDSSQSLIPQVGWLSGDINAGSVQAYYIVETEKLTIEFDNQYSFRLDKQNIYYNWLSAGYHISHLLNVGVASQLYVGPGGNFNDNGVFIAVSKAGYLFTLYDFDAYAKHRHYVAVDFFKDITLGRRKK